MKTTAKPTPGPYTLEHIIGLTLRGPGRSICEFWHNEDQAGNAQFTLDAFRVYHEYGLTPRQLADQRAELIAALRYARRFLRVKDHDVAYVDAVLARAKVVPK